MKTINTSKFLALTEDQKQPRKERKLSPYEYVDSMLEVGYQLLKEVWDYNYDLLNKYDNDYDKISNSFKKMMLKLMGTVNDDNIGKVIKVKKELNTLRKACDGFTNTEIFAICYKRFHCGMILDYDASKRVAILDDMNEADYKKAYAFFWCFNEVMKQVLK